MRIISTVIRYLNQAYGYNIDSTYYAKIQDWQSWWRGYNAAFHRVSRSSDSGSVQTDMYTLPSAYKVCEDWASILLNERTYIKIEDENSQNFFKTWSEQVGFWDKANKLVQKEMYSGTAALIPTIHGSEAGASIKLQCVDALHIIPLSVQYGVVADVAFVSQTIEGGTQYVHVERHLRESGGYRIENKRYVIENGELVETNHMDGIAENVVFQCPYPLFAMTSPNLVNKFDNHNGLGMSIIENVINCIKGVDLAFNNFNMDLFLGGKKVFYNEDMVATDADGNTVSPDEIHQQLFQKVGNGDFSEQTFLQEYNPSLRISENSEAVQAQLDFLSLFVGFGAKHYQFNGTTIVTATQYIGDKQDLVQNASRHMILLQNALIGACRAVLWLARHVLGEDVDPSAGIEVFFEEDFMINRDSEKQNDKDDIARGIMQNWEYRVKWYGENEETAKAMAGQNAQTKL